jgi:hypothetical protein
MYESWVSRWWKDKLVMNEHKIWFLKRAVFAWTLWFDDDIKFLANTNQRISKHLQPDCTWISSKKILILTLNDSHGWQDWMFVGLTKWTWFNSIHCWGLGRVEVSNPRGYPQIIQVSDLRISDFKKPLYSHS